MNLFLPLAIIKSPGHLTEEYRVFSDVIISELIIENMVKIRDPTTE